MKKIIKTSLLLVLLSFSLSSSGQVDTTYRTRDPFLSLDWENKAYVRAHQMDEIAFNVFYKDLLKNKNGESYKFFSNQPASISCSNCSTVTNYCAALRVNETTHTDPKTILDNKGFRFFSGTNISGNTLSPTAASSFNINTTTARDSDRVALFFAGANPQLDNGIPIIPPGENYSIRLGNKINQDESRDALTLKIQVNASNQFIYYNYAFICDDAEHPEVQQPYVKFRVLNSSGSELAHCGNFRFIQPTNGNREVRNWTQNFVDLSSHIGSTLYLYMEVGDCTLGGHTLRAYVNFSCASPFTRSLCTDEEGIYTLDFLNNFKNPTPVIHSGPGVIQDGQLKVSFANAGTYTTVIKVTDPDKPGCNYFYTYVITVSAAGTTCDPQFDLPANGCINEPIVLKATIQDFYKTAKYRIEWLVEPPGYQYTGADGNPVVIFCTPGIKKVTLKIIRVSDNVVVKNLSKNITVKDCDGFYGTLILPDTICMNEQLQLYYPFLTNIDLNKFSYKWSATGSPKFSSISNVDYVSYDFVGKQTISLEIINNLTGCRTSFSKSVFVKDCLGELVCCQSTFAPGPGEYAFSGWVSFDRTLPSSKYPYYRVNVIFQDDRSTFYYFKPKLDTDIDGWYRVAGTVTIGTLVKDIDVEMINPSDAPAYFDDVRMQPFNSSMKGYVFDNITKRMIAEMDENNYATFYEYDEEGNLIRIKKETERGIMTIQESNQNRVKP